MLSYCGIVIACNSDGFHTVIIVRACLFYHNTYRRNLSVQCKTHGSLLGHHSVLLIEENYMAAFTVSRLICNMGYTGLAVGVTDLVGDIYINNLIGGGVEVLSYVLVFTILWGGRKKVYIPLQVIGGCGLIMTAVISVYWKGKEN